MLDGLRYVIAQIALIVAVTALLATVLGWLLGRASGTRRAEKTAAAATASRLTPGSVEPAPSFSPRHAIEDPEDVPAGVAEEVPAPVAPTSIVDVTEPVETPVLDDVAAPQDFEPSSPVEEPVVEPVDEPVDEPFDEPVDEPVDEPFDEPVTTDTLAGPADVGADDDEDDEEDPDRTVLRPAPGRTSTSGTPLYAPPPFTVVTSTLSDSGPTAVRPASVQEVQELRRELHGKELELGKLEAGALSAWDRTVPHLEAQVFALLDENAVLRRHMRDAEEHSDADAMTVQRLRSQVAERDSRLAEIRAQS